MRTFEIILLLTVTILPFIKRPLIRKIPSNYLLIFPGIFLSIHLLFEGWRWQMLPAYLLVLIVGWRIKTVDETKSPGLSFIRGTGFLILSVLIIIGWTLPMALPVFSLPKPTGPYQVGTQMVHFKTNMDESITKDPSDKRELMIKVWYPSNANTSSLEGEKYIDNASRVGFATKYGLPPSALNYLDYVKTYAYNEIPVAEKKYPVLIFSHGYGSKATGYYALLTEIASHGYVIINMNHTFESLGVTFPDGRQEYFDYSFQNEISSGSMEVIEPVINAFRKGLDYEQRHPIVKVAAINYFEGDIQDRWANDMQITIDQLEEWNSKGLLKDKLELDKIGVIGHSVGGGSVGKVALRDHRVKAAVNLDGNQWGELIDSIHHIPFLYVSADWPEDHEDINSHIYINKSTDYFYEIKLLNSGHPDFMDIPFMVPVNSLAGTGEIDPYLGTEIITKLTTAFFDKHLKNSQAASLKELDKKYELLEMTIYIGDSIR
ncbi:alpha/beta hydrolase family protein [Mangrovivirga cuniculi]|uniref:Platelet-activating factor acetylhydrolase n=1 Tax=Mangrovivirga cuniculi TaxID=2715131 RepID=A0A4D7JU40_9BACT|nr:hypothetical protein [Mangrovivirga cuniculi]QCK16132.1 hypothetical protein DCC35_15985 [Mangrovivirga cuniculi]